MTNNENFTELMKKLKEHAAKKKAEQEAFRAKFRELLKVKDDSNG